MQAKRRRAEETDVLTTCSAVNYLSPSSMASKRRAEETSVFTTCSAVNYHQAQWHQREEQKKQVYLPSSMVSKRRAEETRVFTTCSAVKYHQAQWHHLILFHLSKTAKYEPLHMHTPGGGKSYKKIIDYSVIQ